MMRTSRQLLSQTIELYRAHFWLYVGYAAWLLVPTAAFLFLYSILDLESSWVLLFIPLGLTAAFLYFWILAVMTKLTDAFSDQKLIEPQRVSEAALRKITPLLIVTFLLGLITTGGLLLLVIPGIIFAVWYSQANIAIVLQEQMSATQSLAHSKELVRGRFWDVLLYMLSGSLAIGIPYILILGGLISITALFMGLDPLQILDSTEIYLWPEAIQAIIDTIFTPLFIIYYTLLYKELVKHPLEHNAQVA